MCATRVVYSQGALMIARIKVDLGHVRRGKAVIVIIEASQVLILHDGTQLSTHARSVIKEGHPPAVHAATSTMKSRILCEKNAVRSRICGARHRARPRLQYRRIGIVGRSGYWEPTIGSWPVIGGSGIKYVGMVEYGVANAAWIKKFQ